MTPKEYQAELKDLEVKLDRLRSLYDQYFRGFEKLPPTILNKEVENKIRNLSKERMKNTALRFKLQVLIQKHTTFLAYWQRMMREIEDGKVKRGWGVDRAEEEEDTGKFYGQKDRPKREEGDFDIDIDLDFRDPQE